MDRSWIVVAEILVFGPFLFFSLLLLLLLRGLWGRGALQRLCKSALWLWLWALIAASQPFYQVVALPLKWLTPSGEKQKSDAIVVASAGVHESGAPTPGSTLRAYAAGRLYLEGWAPKVIVSGGVTEPYLPPLETKGMHIVLRGMGVPNEDIIIEDRSADTYENGVETLHILQKMGASRILLVSHDYHLYRLLGVFRKLGVQATPYAANLNYPKAPEPWWRLLDWENYSRLRTVAHEYIGLLVYRATGRI